MPDSNQLIPVPLPILGLNTVEAFSLPWESRYAREFTNFMLYNGRVQVRPAFRSQVYNSSFTANPVHWFDKTSTPDWYAILSDGKIRKLSDGTGATTIGGSPAYNATVCKHVSLELVIGCREPRLTTNPFTAWTITTATVTATDIRAACSHKGRLYVFNSNTAEYSSIGQITGAMPAGQTFSFSEFLDGQSILRAFSVTVQPGDQSQNVLAVFGSGGRVLVYSGDYPGSATWALIGKFDMPTPISNVGFVEVDGDLWVSTQSYPYWFRDLFSGGAQTAYANSPGRAIENIWSGVFWASSVALPEVSHSFYDPRLDAVITQCSEKSSGYINLGTIAEYQNEGLYFVYLRKYRAWAVWYATPMFAPFVYPYGTAYNGEIKTISYTDIVDQYDGSNTIDIESSWKTPYFASAGPGAKVNGVRVFFENTVSGYFDKVRVIFDRSDYNSALGWYTQSMVTQVNPGNYGDSVNDAVAKSFNQYNPLIGASGIGGKFSIQFTQKRKSGSSSSQLQSIYDANVYLQPGGNLF